jgi:hypothetical protein
LELPRLDGSIGVACGFAAARTAKEGYLGAGRRAKVRDDCRNDHNNNDRDRNGEIKFRHGVMYA